MHINIDQYIIDEFRIPNICIHVTRGFFWSCDENLDNYIQPLRNMILHKRINFILPDHLFYKNRLFQENKTKTGLYTKNNILI